MRGISVLFLMVAACKDPLAPAQPISFNHQLHLGPIMENAGYQALSCVDCHPGAERETHAGLPSATHCLRCHIKPQLGPNGELHPKEAQVRLLAKDPNGIAWVQVTRNPGHVYFSHRAHTKIGNIACETCHGDVSSWAQPPTRPTPALVSMDGCIECHRKNDAPLGCNVCHK